MRKGLGTQRASTKGQLPLATLSSGTDSLISSLPLKPQPCLERQECLMVRDNLEPDRTLTHTSSVS